MSSKKDIFNARISELILILGNGLNGHGNHLDGLTNFPNGRLNGFDDSDSELEEYLDSSDLPEQVSNSSLTG